MISKIKTISLMTLMLIPSTALLTSAFVLPIAFALGLFATYTLGLNVVLEMISSVLPLTICFITLVVSIVVASACSFSN